MKKSLLLIILFILILGVSLTSVSAALCKGSNGFYTDCSNNAPFNHRYQGDPDRSSSSKFLETHTISNPSTRYRSSSPSRPTSRRSYRDYGYGGYGDSYVSFGGQPGYIGGYSGYSYPYFSGGYGYGSYGYNSYDYGLGYDSYGYGGYGYPVYYSNYPAFTLPYFTY